MCLVTSSVRNEVFCVNSKGHTQERNSREELWVFPYTDKNWISSIQGDDKKIRRVKEEEKERKRIINSKDKRKRDRGEGA